ncbi:MULTISPECIES: nucleotide-binding protein [unclassified Methylophilus]|uniref:nucleotide-binding protein n=1 Tax=unclassified Methylophilus TaxID=2630143 RepID=UPI00036F3148|nr:MULTISPECIES: nucleotide-binding protein [unclassified Methylophilus]
MKPKIFIGSSREGLDIANPIHANLTRDAECTVWSNGVFQISGSTLYSLINALRNSDFGVFVFSPDDLTIMRGQQNPVVRDNVIFELGLFIGRLGVERCFFITPDHVADLRLPTDLMGILPGQYEANRHDQNWLAATNPVCMQIRAKLIELKSFQDATVNAATAVDSSTNHEIKHAISHDHTATDQHLGLEPHGKAYALTGNTHKHKDAIKQAGASWNKGLKKWIIRGSDKIKFERLIADVNSSTY